MQAVVAYHIFYTPIVRIQIQSLDQKAMRMLLRHKTAPRLTEKTSDVGCFTGLRIGDSLISMVSAENLRRSGRSVTIYSNPLHALKRWFPHAQIETIPPPQKRSEILQRHDLLLHAFDSDVLPEAVGMPKTLVYDHLREYRDPLKSQVDINRDLCRSIFGIADASKANGMRHLPEIADRDPLRVVIHPTASDPTRRWSPASFIKVAQGISERGLTPEFVTQPSEVEQTTWIEEAGFSRFAEGGLDQVAERLAGSHAFIGNDSGIAHLASSLGLPFVTVNLRRKLAIRWRPGWSDGETLIPSIPLLINPIKVRYWRKFITSAKVLDAFDRVTSPAIS